MNVRRDLSYFNLTQVDRSLGYEISRSEPTEMGSTMTVLVRFAINPYHDLVLTDAVEFRLYVPTDYHLEGGITVCTEDHVALDYLRKLTPSPVDDHGRVELAGMTRLKYQFPVWFYAARSLFKKVSTEPWGCAVLLRDEFRYIGQKYPQGTCEMKLFCGAGRTRGKRNYMEDVDFVFSSIKVNDKRSISVFGVLDGHGGKECSQFCADDIPVRIAANLRNGSSCPEALHKAFLESDLECLESGASGDAGSTANVAVFDQLHNVFYIANTGDTRAVLSRNGEALDLSFDRKGTDPEEIARVAKAGGFVMKGRLMGTLAVSRALGDLQLKEQGNQKLQRVLIPDPELSAFYPTQKEDFLIIATDGLWDVMTSQAAVNHTRALLTQEGLLGNGDVSALGDDIINMRLSQVANNIAVHSVSNLGSMDNVTVLIILLNNAPATCPVRLPSPITYHARTFNAIERRDNGENNSARWGAEAGSKSDYSSGTRGAPIPTVSAASSFKKEEVELDTYLDDDGHEAGVSRGVNYSNKNSSGTATVVFTRGNSLLSAQSSSSSSSKSYPVEPTSAPNNVYNSSKSNSHKKASLNDSVEVEDDMMDFLTDDSNF